VGSNIGGSITNNSYASGSVRGDSNVGGLVGYNNGSIDSSGATGIVSGSEGRIGGLVGLNDGSINNSSAQSSVSGRDNVGGLVG
jgi:hypothetical protein